MGLGHKLRLITLGEYRQKPQAVDVIDRQQVTGTREIRVLALPLLAACFPPSARLWCRLLLWPLFSPRFG